MLLGPHEVAESHAQYPVRNPESGSLHQIAHVQFVVIRRAQDLGITLELYSAIQSTSMETGLVGHCRPSWHMALCSKSSVIGTDGTSYADSIDDQTCPSTMYRILAGVQTTPQVCH